MRFATAVVLALTAFAASHASARFMNLAEPVPIDRLLANLTAHVETHPDDAAGHYTLGRVHSLAYAKLAYGSDESAPEDSVDVIPAEKTPKLVEDATAALPAFPPYATLLVGPRGEAGRPADDEPQASPAAAAHLAASLAAYRRAVALDPDEGLYHLGLGWMSEQASRYGDGPTTRPAEEAKAAYRRAIAVSYEAELDMDQFRGVERNFIATEAAMNLLAMLRGEGVNDAETAELEAKIARLKQRPIVMTPIIFATREADLDDLLRPHARATFDLAADGLGRAWPWVSPDASLLVWDPAAVGRITSGTQLLGTRSWSMVFRDGYAALAALDDDADGHLRGGELVGLAAWNDRDGDGVSDPGEVRPLADLGVAGIAVVGEPHRRDDIAVWQPAGVTFDDGRTLATWDWMPTSHR